MSAEEWQIVWFTAWVSALSTLIILPFGLRAAWALARRDWPGKSMVETFVTLPLVMPPVATGLILLQIFGRRGAIGGFLHSHFNLDIVFTWRGVLLALAVMSLPLLVRSARVAFEEVNPRLEQIARTLGAGNCRVFFTITLPLAARGIVGGMLLAFARALGEFGATIMVAGNIPGKTSTLSLAIFQNVQLGQDADAFRLLGVSVVLAFAAVWCSEFLLRQENTDMSLLLKNISLPLAPFTLEVDVEMHGRVTAIFGPSGAGKTSLLDLIAGLRRPQSAFIQLDDRVLTDTAKECSVPTHQRGIGYVPQDLALFPHFSVRQNLLYGCKPGGAVIRCSASIT